MSRRSYIFRLAALYSFVVVAIALVLGVMGYRVVRTEMRAELDRRILLERDTLLRESGAKRQDMVGLVDGRVRHGVEDMYYAFVDDHGQSLAGSRVNRPLAPGWATVGFQDGRGNFDDARSIVTAIPSGERLVVGADPETIERLDERIGPLFALVVGLMALAGVGCGLLLSSQMRRRLDAITGTAEAIIAGEFQRRMPVGARNDEFDRLSGTLNRMLDRIEGLMANFRQVSSDIAHDLRTPLTRLRQKLETGASSNNVAVMKSALADASAQADEVLELFTAILSIAAIESGGRLSAKPFDLSLLVSDLAESYILAAEDTQRSLQFTVEPGLVIEGQRELVAQLLVNLLDNALRHTPPGSRIELSLTRHDGAILLAVADNGPGIAPQDRARVFERFVRLDRSRSTPGHGLGLRLVAAIAEAHGATIVLEDNNPGVRMSIRFRQFSQ